METIKTAVVVVLLLAVLYGVYVVLNKPDLGSAPETAWESPPVIEEGTPVDPTTASPGTQPTAFAAPDYAAPSQPEMAPTPAGPSGEDESHANVTDLVPTPADPPAGSESEAIPSLELTPIPAPTGELEEVAPPSSTATSVYDSASIDDAPAKGAAGTTPDATGVGLDNLPPSQYATEDAADPQPDGVFETAWNTAVGQLEKSQWKEALRTLSSIYNDPNVDGEARSRLMDLLDPLAGKVIYSAEHILEPPYEVRPDETLQGIADRYHVPAILLQNVNGIRDPNRLQPGTQLKVLRGPFRAEIDRKQGELVLFLNEYYAGRFAVSIGNDPDPQAATYQVQAKQPGREYFTPDQSRIPARAPDNPYGDWWIGLSDDSLTSNGLVSDSLVGDVCIHGSPESTPLNAGLGCISLRSADAADVYHILTVGSKVVIR